MHKALALAVILLPASLATGQSGKDPAEEFVVKILGELEKLAESLAAMKDEASVAAGHEELKKIVKAYAELRAEAEKLAPPPREVRDRLAKEYKKKLVAVQEKLVVEVARVRGLPGGPAALKEVAALLAGKELKLDEKTKEKDSKTAKDAKTTKGM